MSSESAIVRQKHNIKGQAMSRSDLPINEAMPLINIKKSAPEGVWRPLSQGKIEKWEYAVGVVVDDDPNLRGALSIQLQCMRNFRPKMVSYQFGLFYREFGVPKRVYMVESGDPQLGQEGEHTWPHEHIGDTRSDFPTALVPKTFDEVLAKFTETCFIELEEPIEDPFEFRLKP